MSVWNNTVEKRCEYEALSSKEAPIAQDVDGSQHICNICEFSHATKEILKVHTRSHNPEKRYKCDQCNYEGNQSRILVSHIRSNYSNLWNNHEDCEFKASQRGNLKVYFRKMHEGIVFGCLSHLFICSRNMRYMDFMWLQSGNERKYECAQTGVAQRSSI